jgi:hypothetical protein
VRIAGQVLGAVQHPRQVIDRERHRLVVDGGPVEADVCTQRRRVEPHRPKVRQQHAERAGGGHRGSVEPIHARD